MHWIDEEIKQETLEAMREGRAFEEQYLLYDQYRATEIDAVEGESGEPEGGAPTDDAEGAEDSDPPAPPGQPEEEEGTDG